MRRPAQSAIAVAALAAACGGGEASRTDSVVAMTAAPGSAPVASVADPNVGVQAAGRATMGPKGCLHDGRWRVCSLVDRLERSGLVIPAPEADSARYEFLGVPGVRYKVRYGELQAFVYDDTARLARDVAALDTVHVSPKGTTRHWDAPVTFVRSGNLAVVLLTGNEHLVERVQLAVQAGPPQPNPDEPAVELPAMRAK